MARQLRTKWSESTAKKISTWDGIGKSLFILSSHFMSLQRLFKLLKRWVARASLLASSLQGYFLQTTWLSVRVPSAHYLRQSLRWTAKLITGLDLVSSSWHNSFVDTSKSYQGSWYQRHQDAFPIVIQSVSMSHSHTVRQGAQTI